VTMYTDNDYGYMYSRFLPTYNYLAFKVRTCNDAHLLLSSSGSLDGPSYEIVLGGYDNQYSDIRPISLGGVMTQAYTPNILSCNELLPVWVRWRSQTLEVGIGPLGAHTILRHDDPEMPSILAASVTSWYSAVGEYQFLENQGKVDVTFILVRERSFLIVHVIKFVDCSR